MIPSSDDVSTRTATNNDHNKTSNEDTSHYFVTPEIRKPSSNNSKNRIELSTPYAILKQSPLSNKVDVITPESDGQWKMMTCLAPTKNIARNGRKFNTQNHTNPSSQVLIETSNLGSNRNHNNQTESSGHSFGVLCLDQESVNLLNRNNVITNTKVDNKHGCLGRKESNQQDAQMLIDNNEQSLVVNPVTTNNLPSKLTRRSSRLINSDTRSIKENSTSAKKIVVDRRVTPVKRCRRTISFDKSQKIVKQNNNENDSTLQDISFDVTKTGINAERSSANGLLELIKKFAIAYKRLAEYRCREAIECFKKLPLNHYNTGFVLTMIGRCHFEMGAHDDAISCFKTCRQIEPYRLQGLETYSTALWHLQKELELSCLSQELIQFDKLAPETWCVAGNCFSLQKDHEISIKFLKRAIQVDPNFSYAYTLLGHELISADELDNAMSCFVNATRIDPRHYNAWCGIGLIYYKQEKYDLAYQNYKRSLDISSNNPLLMCHLALILYHLKKSRDAIHLLNEASKIDPQNVIIKYNRALIRFHMEEYDQSLVELEELKTMVPKESLIFFLIGRIHKIRGETHLALLNFSWAVHIDPKGSANQHKEFTEPNQTSPEEFIVHTGHIDTSSEMSSTPTTTPFTQRSTYITGPINYSNISLEQSIDMAEINELIDNEVDEEEDAEQDDEEIDSEYPVDSNTTEEDM
ncbi:anaphase-promoting complex subunit cdc27 [Dermatophagoides farinae]|nr:anaphase-promoting complex subunit cdc27 [Dermatophagoides farinae]